MKWIPISEAEIYDIINRSWDRMTLEQRNIWEAIKIDPQKWDLQPYGKEGGGFWVVAILGNTVIWFNDIEGGFNRSRYSKPGTIQEYYCNQDLLENQIQNVIDHMRDGYNSAGKCSAPM